MRGARAYPLELAGEDPAELRRALSAAQGSNPTRRIRLVLRVPGVGSVAELGRRLVGG